jgi:hypothetical protein
VWYDLSDWRVASLELFGMGIDASKHDRKLYDILILLLKTHFSDEQVDFIVWSIFDDKRTLEADGRMVKIDTGEACWEYVCRLDGLDVKEQK